MLTLVLLVLGGIFAYRSWQHYTIQKQHKAEVEQLIEERSEYTASINAVSKPEWISEETWQTLKTGALGEFDESLILQYDPNEELEDSLYEEIMKLNPKGNEEEASFVLNINQYDEDILEYYLKDTDRYTFVQAWPERSSLQAAPETLSESLDSVPHLLQWDTRWGYIPYGDSTIYYAGCAPTSLSMVFSYLLQDPTITPAVLAEFSMETGNYVEGVGTAHSLLSQAADAYGISVRGIGVDVDSLQEAFDNGEVLILNMVPGTFTQVGHFIVATGMENGKLKVLDPNSIKRTQTLWDPEEVLSETAAIWAYSNPNTAAD